MIVLDGSWEDWPAVPGRTSVTIGVLDGVHIGHKALLAELDQKLTATVLTFDPHPAEVLRPGTSPRLITTIEERLALLETTDMVSCVGVLNLAEIKELAPEVFVDKVLVGSLQMAHLVVGEDFRFGKDRTGDVALLGRLGSEMGFVVEPISLVTVNGSPVSSSRIRELIEAGEVTTAADLLGSRFTLSSQVVDGDKRGREIGFPTANLRPPRQKVIPANGVYSCFAGVGDAVHPAAVNVGVRPTFGGGELLIEAFLLGFDDDIYGNVMTIEFVQYMRPELEFADVDDLVAQMRQDVIDVRTVLSGVRSGI